MPGDTDLASLSAAIERTTDAEHYRAIAADIARQNYRNTLEISRLEEANRALIEKCERWRIRWELSYGVNLVAVAAALGYVFIHWVFN